MALTLFRATAPSSVAELQREFLVHGLHHIDVELGLTCMFGAQSGFEVMSPRCSTLFCVDAKSKVSVAACDDGSLARFDGWTHEWTSARPESEPRTLSMSGDGSTLVVCTADGSVLHFTEGLTQIQKRAQHARSISLSFDANVLAVVLQATRITKFITTEKSTTHDPRGSTLAKQFEGIALTRDGSLAGLLFADHVRVVDTHAGELLARAPFEDATPEHELAFSAGGTYLVAWHPVQHTATIWQVQ